MDMYVDMYIDMYIACNICKSVKIMSTSFWAIFTYQTVLLLNCKV